MAVSVIIPLGGASVAFIDEQLAALALQSGEDIREVLIATNLRGLGVPELEARWRDRLPLRLVDAWDHRGPSYARNMAARAAAGEELAFCDADDRVMPGWARAMDEALREDNVFVTGPVDLDALNPPWMVDHITGGHREELEKPFTLGWKPFAIGANFGIRRATLERVGGFDPEMLALGDIELSWRLLLAGVQYRHVPGARISYRYNTSTLQAFRKRRYYGQWSVELCRRFQPHGLPVRPFSWRGFLRRYWQTLVRHGDRLRTAPGRFAIAWELGDHIGVAQGSVRFHFPMG